MGVRSGFGEALVTDAGACDARLPAQAIAAFDGSRVINGLPAGGVRAEFGVAAGASSADLAQIQTFTLRSRTLRA